MNFEPKSDKIGIDETQDYYNEDHLNVLGAKKFTKYLSKYIDNHYNLKKEHSEEVTKEWEDCVSYTKKAFDILTERTLANEDTPYDEYTDLSDENHQKLLDHEKMVRKKAEEEAARELEHDEVIIGQEEVERQRKKQMDKKKEKETNSP